MPTVVWAFRPLPELNHQTGFVECDDALARELLAADTVQDPNVGALHLRDIEPASSQKAIPPAEDRSALTPDDSHTYETTQLTPARSSRRRK